MDTHYLVVDPSGNPIFKGADALEAGGFYRAHVLSGHGLMTEAEFREWASNLGRDPDGRPLPGGRDLSESFRPSDAPMDELVAHCNRVGWRVLALLGENVYVPPDESAYRAADEFYSGRRR
jgi:hypothetical protein